VQEDCYVIVGIRAHVSAREPNSDRRSPGSKRFQPSLSFENPIRLFWRGESRLPLSLENRRFQEAAKWCEIPDFRNWNER
jgi:hypothetical protein